MTNRVFKSSSQYICKKGSSCEPPRHCTLSQLTSLKKRSNRFDFFSPELYGRSFAKPKRKFTQAIQPERFLHCNVRSALCSTGNPAAERRQLWARPSRNPPPPHVPPFSPSVSTRSLVQVTQRAALMQQARRSSSGTVPGHATSATSRPSPEARCAWDNTDRQYTGGAQPVHRCLSPASRRRKWWGECVEQ